MPWKPEDADKHKSGLSDDQKKKWAKIANRVLDDSGDEGKAIRVANSQVSKSLAVEAEMIKHLLGRHNQKDHGGRSDKPYGHTREEHGTTRPHPDKRRTDEQKVHRFGTGDFLAAYAGTKTVAEREKRINELRDHLSTPGGKQELIHLWNTDRKKAKRVLDEAQKFTLKDVGHATLNSAEKLKEKLKRKMENHKLAAEVIDVVRQAPEDVKDIPALESAVGKSLLSPTELEFAKHLIGRHEQDDHNPHRKRNPRAAEAGAPHRRKDHRTKKQAERHKARVRRITRRIGEVTGMGATAYVADVARRVAQGVDPEKAVKDSAQSYKRIGQAIAASGKKVVNDLTDKVKKAMETDMDFTVAGEFSKFEEDEQLAFGWASITEMDGQPVIDRQGDFIPTTELEKAAYEYVLESRVGGEMHKKDIHVRKGVETKPRQVATLVESMVFTPEKIEKLGLPEEFPSGWWIGFKVHDNEVWKSVKDGKYNSFSIHGMGKRVPMNKTQVSKSELDQFRELIDQYGAQKVAKHLIGSHDQGSHGREEHGTSKDPGQLSDTQRRRNLGQVGPGLLAAGPAGLVQNAIPGASGGRGTTFMFENNWGRKIPLVGDNPQVFQTDAASLGTRGALAGGLSGAASTLASGEIDPMKMLVRGGIGALAGGGVGAGIGALSDKQRKKRGDTNTRMFGKNLRRYEVLKDLGNVSKSEEEVSEALDEIAKDFSELRKDGEIDREFDIPVDSEQYGELIKYFSEEKADARYEGDWVQFEDYLGAVSDVVKSGDEQSILILGRFL